MTTPPSFNFSEYVIPFLITQTNAGIAFILTEGMFTVLVVQFFTVLLFVLKDVSDRRTRKEERDERKADREAAVVARKTINEKIDDNTVMNATALNAANGLKAEIADSIKLVETAATLISQPQQTKPLGDSAENPVHTITP